MPLREDAFDRIGTLKPIDDQPTARQLREILGVHQAALLQLNGDQARIREQAARMTPETGALLTRAQNARVEFVPEGDDARCDARYVLSDGSIRWSRSIEVIELPDGSSFEARSEGLLDDPWPVTPLQQRLQRAYASLGLAYLRARSLGISNPWTEEMMRKAFVNFRKAALAMPGMVGAHLRAVFESGAAGQGLRKRVIDGTSGQGGEVIGVPTIPNVRQPANLARRLPGLVAMRQAPSPSFKPPIITGRALAKRRGATTNDPAAYPVRSFTTSDATVTVVNQELTVLLDPLWLADAAKILGDPMGFVMEWIGQGWMDTLEAAILHGDTAGTHQDTLSTWTMGGLYTAGDLDGSNSPLKWWIGLRPRAADDSNTASAGGTFDAADHFGALELLGVHSRGAVMITGLHCLYTQILANSLFTTVDKYGQYATLLPGQPQIGSVGETPIVLSQMIGNDFDSTSGLYTGSNASTEIVYANLERTEHYELLDGADAFDVTRPERGAQYVGEVRRSVITYNCVSGEKPASVLYNL